MVTATNGEYPVDFDEPVGRVRKYIPDLVPLADPEDPDGATSFIFSDEEIGSFISDENPVGITGWGLKRAAAYAMIALGNSENLILKKITTQDQQTDGPSVAKQLIAAAAALMARADAEEAAATAIAVNEPETFRAVFPPQTHQHNYRRYYRTRF